MFYDLYGEGSKFFFCTDSSIEKSEKDGSFLYKKYNKGDISTISDLQYFIMFICSIGDVCNWYWLLHTLALYKKVSSGSCASNGVQLVRSKYECKSAAKALGLPYITAHDAHRSIFPPGCIYRDSDNFLVWNTMVSSSIHCGSDLGDPGVYDCLCIKG